MFLSHKLGFAEIWDEKVSNRQRFLTPLAAGIFIGLFFIVSDILLSLIHGLGRLPHPPFPTSLVASLAAGIGEELIFRLFFISFWLWLISYVILKKKAQQPVFWIVTTFSALTFAFGHLPSAMFIYHWTSFGDIPPMFLVEIILLNGVLSYFAAYYFRQYGFLAAVGVHFWTDIVWHVAWGTMG